MSEPRTAAVHEPGDSHRYALECSVCGEHGLIRVTIDPERAEPIVDVGVLARLDDKAAEYERHEHDNAERKDWTMADRFHYLALGVRQARAILDAEAER